jgi:hypothetical protein
MLYKAPTRKNSAKTRKNSAPDPATKKPSKATEKPSPELLAEMSSGPGGGLSQDILDNAFWRKEHEPDDAWVSALDLLDRLGNKEPLTQLLLNSGLPGRAGEYLADLIERGVPVGRGRPKVPGYRPNKKEGMLMLALDYIRALILNGMPEAAALDKVAAEHGIERRTLLHAFQGKRGSLSRAKKRL